MKAQELRLNNWIDYAGSGEVQLKTKESLMNVFDDLECEYPRSSPIPLTEEWLLKFGFKRDDLNGHYYATWRRFYPLYNRGKYYGFNGLGLSVKDIEYVHQLQNLYFALTGEELNLHK